MRKVIYMKSFFFERMDGSKKKPKSIVETIRNTPKSDHAELNRLADEGIASMLAARKHEASVQ